MVELHVYSNCVPTPSTPSSLRQTEEQKAPTLVGLLMKKELAFDILVLREPAWRMTCRRVLPNQVHGIL
jgi:hypothetical protein